MRRKGWGIVSLVLVAMLLGLALLACAKPAPTATPAPATPKPTAAAPAPAPAPTTATPKPTATPTPSPTATFQPITLKFGTFNPETADQSKFSKWMCDAITERTGGKLKFQYFWGGSLFKAGEELDSLRTRVADIGILAYTNFLAQMPMAQIGTAFPWGPKSGATATKVMRTLYGEFPAMRQEAEKYNLKVLFLLSGNSYQLNTVKPVQTLKDVAGLKLATIGEWDPKIAAAGGAVAVGMPSPDRYMALKTGVVQGTIFGAEYCYNWKLYEVAKYMTLPDFGGRTWGFVAINTNLFNSLPPDIQKIITDTALEAEAKYVGAMDGIYNNALDGWKKNGGTVSEFPEAEKTKWVNAMTNSPMDYAAALEKQGLPGNELVKRYVAFSEAAGHKFPRNWLAQ